MPDNVIVWQWDEWGHPKSARLRVMTFPKSDKIGFDLSAGYNLAYTNLTVPVAKEIIVLLQVAIEKLEKGTCDE